MGPRDNTYNIYIIGSYDMILLDVDSKDASVGMSSPPDVFLNKDFLESCKSLLTSSGQFKSQ